MQDFRTSITITVTGKCKDAERREYYGGIQKIPTPSLVQYLDSSTQKNQPKYNS